MCRTTAAPLMAMAGMAGTAIGVAIAVLKEKADRRSFKREAEEELEGESAMESPDALEPPAESTEDRTPDADSDLKNT